MADRIIVGSLNPAKIEAVAEIVREYPHLADLEVIGVDASSDISAQPKSLEETIHGAMNRAKNAFHDCRFSVGIESGLMAVPETKSGFMDVCVCAVFDGEQCHLGLSSAWEFPDPSVMHSIFSEGLDMSQAINKAGLTKNAKIGSQEGAIGILTKGRLNRKEYTKQALRTALIHVDQIV